MRQRVRRDPMIAISQFAGLVPRKVLQRVPRVLPIRIVRPVLLTRIDPRDRTTARVPRDKMIGIVRPDRPAPNTATGQPVRSAPAKTAPRVLRVEMALRQVVLREETMDPDRVRRGAMTAQVPVHRVVMVRQPDVRRAEMVRRRVGLLEEVVLRRVGRPEEVDRHRDGPLEEVDRRPAAPRAAMDHQREDLRDAMARRPVVRAQVAEEAVRRSSVPKTKPRSSGIEART